MSDLDHKDWRELSEAASREQDPQKLMELIRALNSALERREKKARESSDAPPAAETIKNTNRDVLAA